MEEVKEVFKMGIVKARDLDNILLWWLLVGWHSGVGG